MTVLAIATVVGATATLTYLPGSTLAASYTHNPATGRTPPPPTVTSTATRSLTNSSGSPDPANSAAATSRATLHPCRHLLVAAALTLGADPASWIVTLIDQGGRTGGTLDQAIYDRLVSARTALDENHHSDLEAITAGAAALDSVIDDAARHPCSATPCSPDKPRRTDRGFAPYDTLGAHAGWYWLCTP